MFNPQSLIVLLTSLINPIEIICFYCLSLQYRGFCFLFLPQLTSTTLGSCFIKEIQIYTINLFYELILLLPLLYILKHHLPELEYNTLQVYIIKGYFSPLYYNSRLSFYNCFSHEFSIFLYFLCNFFISRFF